MADPGSISAFAVGILLGRVVPEILSALPDTWHHSISAATHWLARCQYTVTGLGNKFDVQLLYQCDCTYFCRGPFDLWTANLTSFHLISVYGREPHFADFIRCNFNIDLRIKNGMIAVNCTD